MAFAKKMMGFPSYLVSFWTKLPSKGYERINVTFITEGMFQEMKIDWSTNQLIDDFYPENKTFMVLDVLIESVWNLNR